MQQDGATRSTDAGRATFDPVPLPSQLRQLRWRASILVVRLRGLLEQELAERAGFNWLAVVFATGCLAYFALPREPLFPLLLIATPSAAATAMVAYWRGAPWRIAAVAAVCLAGATAAKIRVEVVATPHVERPVVVRIEGRVVDRETRAERRPRVVLDEVRSDSIPGERMPERIRITVSERYGLPPLAARVAAHARLMPVAGPVVPGGYDPRRAAFFERIGSSGFMLGGWHLVERPPGFSVDLAIPRLRAAMVERIMAAEPGEAGAVAAALLVGERSALSDQTNESLRLSGMAHILSISGLHMMLIAGTAFFIVRALLAFSPSLALAYPIRKWAAVAALVMVTFYFGVSGASAATVRAYVMAVVVFAAILLDRPAISMRNLAIAAFVVLGLEPENITEPGFQMSFAAVAALIAGWEFWSERSRRRLTDDDGTPGIMADTFLRSSSHGCRRHHADRRLGDGAFRGLPFRTGCHLFTSWQPPCRAARLRNHHAVWSAQPRGTAVRTRDPTARCYGQRHRVAAPGFRLGCGPTRRRSARAADGPRKSSLGRFRPAVALPVAAPLASPRVPRNRFGARPYPRSGRPA